MFLFVCLFVCFFCQDNESIVLHTFLSILEPSAYVEVLLREAIYLAQCSRYYSPEYYLLVFGIGDKLEKKYQQKLMQKNGDIQKMHKLYEVFTDQRIARLASPLNNTNNHREDWTQMKRLHKLNTVGLLLATVTTNISVVRK